MSSHTVPGLHNMYDAVIKYIHILTLTHPPHHSTPGRDPGELINDRFLWNPGCLPTTVQWTMGIELVMGEWNGDGLGGTANGFGAIYILVYSIKKLGHGLLFLLIDPEVNFPRCSYPTIQSLLDDTFRL